MGIARTCVGECGCYTLYWAARWRFALIILRCTGSNRTGGVEYRSDIFLSWWKRWLNLWLNANNERKRCAAQTLRHHERESSMRFETEITRKARQAAIYHYSTWTLYILEHSNTTTTSLGCLHVTPKPATHAADIYVMLAPTLYSLWNNSEKTTLWVSRAAVIPAVKTS